MRPFPVTDAMELRPACGQCHRPLSESAPAYICSSESTWCPECYRSFHGLCPECGGELVRRPRPSRRASAADVAAPPCEAPTQLRIRRAEVADVPAIAPLFDQYRQFYGESPDHDGAAKFLLERLSRGESTVLVAEESGRAVGFVQLYPMFSSVSMDRMFVLNDLFVDLRVRRRGIGRSLLAEARSVALAAGARSMILDTAVDNPAQRLYESDGWVMDTAFLHYERHLSDGVVAARSPGSGP